MRMSLGLRSPQPKPEFGFTHKAHPGRATEVLGGEACGTAHQGGGRKPGKAGGRQIKSGTRPLLTQLSDYGSSQEWHSSHSRGPSQQRPRPNACSSSQQWQQRSQGWQNYNPSPYGGMMTGKANGFFAKAAEKCVHACLVVCGCFCVFSYFSCMYACMYVCMFFLYGCFQALGALI